MSTQITKRELGDGTAITVLGLGTWAIGGPWARGWGSQDDAESRDAIHRAIDAGVNWIDTAPVYGRGHSETVVGSAVAERSADERPLVMTKCGRSEREDGKVVSDGSAATIAREVEESRERLGMDVLDVLQLHWPPSDVPLEESWTAIARAKSEGAARLIGACNVTVEQVKALESIEKPDLIQIPLSLVKRSAVDELLPYCEERGIGVIVYAPMQSGLLTGKYDHDSVQRLEDGDWRKTDPEFTRPKLDANLRIVEVLRDIAEDHQSSIGEVAIAWTLAQRGVTGAIVGARSSAQVDGWIGAEGLSLSAEELTWLDEVSR